MDAYQITANEKFFDDILRVLLEGGKWGWLSEGEALTKKGDQLLGSVAAINKVERIVSQEYFKKHFAIYETNQS